MSNLVSKLDSSNYIPEFKKIDILPLVGLATHYFRHEKYIPNLQHNERVTSFINEFSFYLYQIFISTVVLTPYLNK